MSFALSTYSTDNFQHGNRDITVNFKKVENGFVVDLHGHKWAEKENFERKLVWGWESTSATFVYPNLEDGLKEVRGFFETLEKLRAKNKEEKKSN